MDAPVLTPEQLAAFRTQGCVRLEGLHPKARLAPLRRQIDGALAQLERGRGAGAGALARLSPLQQTNRLSTLVQVPDLHAQLLTPALCAAVAVLADNARLSATTQLLLSPARQGDPSHTRANWHVDIAAGPEDPLPGIQAFHLLDDVAPQGGATLALAGFHRLRIDKARALRGALKDTPDMAALERAFGVRQLEMSGRAGDVFLMDMRVLHTPSVNTRRALRMMATTRFVVERRD